MRCTQFCSLWCREDAGRIWTITRCHYTWLAAHIHIRAYFAIELMVAGSHVTVGGDTLTPWRRGGGVGARVVAATMSPSSNLPAWRRAVAVCDFNCARMARRQTTGWPVSRHCLSAPRNGQLRLIGARCGLGIRVSSDATSYAHVGAASYLWWAGSERRWWWDFYTGGGSRRAPDSTHGHQPAHGTGK